VSEGTLESSSVDVGRYVSVLRRRWLVILATTLVGLGLALAFLAVRPPLATATALVNVNVISADPFDNAREPSGLIDPQTEVQTARSSAVLAAAADEVGTGVTPSELRASLALQVLTDATVMRISYSSEDRAEAIAATDAVAEQYLAYRSQLASERIGAITQRLADKRNELRDQLRAVNQRLADAQPGTSRAVQAESDRQLLNLELDSLLTRINTAESIDISGGTVLTAAEQNQVYLKPSRRLVLASGLLGGLLLGVVLAFARNYQDRRVFDGHDVTSAKAGPYLGTVPPVSRNGSALDPQQLETVRGVRERLLATLPAGHSSLSVVDLGGRVASEAPVALAVTMAQAGQDVELVLAGYQPEELERIARDFGLAPTGSGDSGVPSYGSDRFPSLTTLVVNDDPRSGRPAASVLDDLLTRAAAPAGVTVISVAPGVGESLRLSAARLSRAVIALVRRRRTSVDELAHLASEVPAVGARLHGTILLATKG
jgi:uncharacterized protein involved in exopolysaccharide biosynthesis